MIEALSLYAVLISNPFLMCLAVAITGVLVAAKS
jgi:hypothetical protein